MPSADEHRECDRNASRRRLLLARVLGELTAAIFSMFSRPPGGSAAESWGGHSESFDPARLPANDGQLHCLQARMTGPPPPQVVADVARTPSDGWDRNRFPPYRSLPVLAWSSPAATTRLVAWRRATGSTSLQRSEASQPLRSAWARATTSQPSAGRVPRVPLNRTRRLAIEQGVSPAERRTAVRTGSPSRGRGASHVACLVACQKCHLIARRVESDLIA